MEKQSVHDKLLTINRLDIKNIYYMRRYILRGEIRGKSILFYVVAVWESVRLEYSDSRLLLNEVRDGDNLRDSGKLFQRNAPL